MGKGKICFPNFNTFSSGQRKTPSVSNTAKIKFPENWLLTTKYWPVVFYQTWETKQNVHCSVLKIFLQAGYRVADWTHTFTSSSL